MRERKIDFPTARILHALYNIHCRQKGDPEIPFQKFMLNQSFEDDMEGLRQAGLEYVKNLVTSLGGEITL